MKIAGMFNIRNVLISSALGLLAFIMIYFKINIIIPGTNIASDPREVFVLIGSALTGPIGAAIVAILASFYDPAENLRMYVIAQHIFGAVLISLFYKYIINKSSDGIKKYIYWAVLVFSYYYIFYLPIYFISYHIDSSLFLTVYTDKQNSIQLLTRLYYLFIPEFIFTLFITSGIIFILPKRFSIPQWGTINQINIDNLLEKKRHRFTNKLLTLRLTILILLFILFPMLILGLFIKNDINDSYYLEDAKYKMKLAKILCCQHKNMDELKKDLLLGSNSGEFEYILTDDKLTIIDASHKKFINNSLSDFFSTEDIEKLNLKNGNFISKKLNSTIGFSDISSSDYKLILFSNLNILEKNLSLFSIESIEKIFLVLLIIIISTILYIFYFIGKPISRFVDAANNIAGGNFDSRMELTDLDDELLILADAFNRMTEKLKSYNKFLLSEINLRKISEETIKKQVAELESNKLEIENFYNTLSNDLKSPLITILGFAGLLNKSVINKNFDKLGNDVSRIIKAAENMQSLLNNAISFSFTSKIHYEFASFGMSDVVKESIESISQHLSNSNISLSFNGDMPFIFADRDKIKSTWLYLIDICSSISVLFNTKKMQIGCSSEKDSIFFIMVEKGNSDSGIDTSDIIKHLSENQQLELSIVKNIIKLHHGELTIDNKNTGHFAIHFSLNSTPSY